ncbi:MAG: methyl-accepting chemotaxis protein [Deltaproteobacteria bacterium]|nr:methyl-accepting chemotaxis protein [Deltaproteobacteria bacterium]MBW2359817.1 methyl-accepting chemotaxis protein [Deltaproteobacteria bacterium]
MRVSLTHKFVVGACVVGAAVVGFPLLLGRAGVAVAPWATPFVALFVGGALGYFFSRQLTRTFQRLHGVTDAIARGDLSKPVAIERVSQFPDEIDSLVHSIEGMVAGLRALVEHVQTTSDRVSQAAGELMRSTGQVSTGNEEISATVSELARSVIEQQKLLHDANTAIREIASTIERNSDRAREAFGFAAEANQKANSGVDVARLAIEKMRMVFEGVEQSVARVFDLEAKTRHVNQITSFITSVAQRTNLLSLNASIEAARAGEAGRGFAVVAEEIRKLAESAGESAEEIAKLISEIETDTHEVADEMRESSLGVREGREDIDTIAHSLEHIRSAVGEAATRAEEIFLGADSQTQDIERMVGAMDEVSRAAETNGVAIEGVVNTSQRQIVSTQEMEGCSETVTELAEQLAEVLRRFETGDVDGRAAS